MAIIEPPPQHYYYRVTDSTSSVSYAVTSTYHRVYQVRWYSNYDDAVTTSAEVEIDEQESPQNWTYLRKHFTGFKGKRISFSNRDYTIRQPMKCHRNIRRERIQRFMKKL